MLVRTAIPTEHERSIPSSACSVSMRPCSPCGCAAKLKPSSVERFLAMVHDQDISAHNLVHIVSILAQRPSLHTLAGEQAVQDTQAH